MVVDCRAFRIHQFDVGATVQALEFFIFVIYFVLFWVETCFYPWKYAFHMLKYDFSFKKKYF